MNSSRRRRAAIQVQFTWIFALVAGAVILLFFVMFIGKWVKSSEQTFCADVREQLTTVFAGAQTSLGTMNNISIPNLDIQFDCTGYNLPCRESFGNNIIFSPERIQGHALITYALGWDMPYRSANMFYLTQPEARYIFIKPGVNEFYDLMPDAVNKELVSKGDAADLKKQNSPHVRVVVQHSASTLDLDIGALNSLDDDVLSVIGIEIGTELNKVTYFEQDSEGSQKFNPTATFEVVGEEALLGAVFSGNSELFECTLNRALERYQYVTEVYLYRADNLTSANLPKTCTDRYKDAFDKLDELLGDILTYASSGSPGSITTRIEEISALNNQLKLFSCPTLY